MAKQIGYYNATHEHGDPLEGLLRKLKARRQGGAAGIAGQGVHSGALAMGGTARNRAQAPMGEMPNWVAQQIKAQGGLPPVPPGGVPEGVTPTKPPIDPNSVGTRNPMAGQGAYPIRRPQSVPHQGMNIPRKRRLPSWLTQA